MLLCFLFFAKGEQLLDKIYFILEIKSVHSGVISKRKVFLNTFQHPLHFNELQFQIEKNVEKILKSTKNTFEEAALTKHT